MDESNVPQTPVPPTPEAVQSAPSPAQTNTNQPNSFLSKPASKYGILGGVVVLLIVAGVFGYRGFQQKAIQDNNPLVTGNTPLPVATTTPDLTQATSTPDNNSTSTIPTFPPVDQAPDPYAYQNCESRGPVSSAQQSGQVQWQEPKLISTNTLFASIDKNSGFAGDYTYLVGHFVSGKYNGADLLLGEANIEEMGYGQYWYYIVHQGSKYILLDKYSDGLLNDSQIKTVLDIKNDEDFTLSDLEWGKTLHSDNPPADFYVSTTYYNRPAFFCADGLIKVFTDAIMGDVYTDFPSTQNTSFSNGFYVKLPSGLKQTYEFNIPIIGSDNIPLVTFSNNKKNTEEYSFKAIGGCGSSQFMDVWNINPSDLVQVGTTVDSKPIYGYKNTNTDELKTMYNEIYVAEGETKPSYSAFLQQHPIFFWQDPFGQFIRFKITKYQPMAECAKPVIYLYPQQAQKISVHLNPLGGFSYTEPSYGNGWNVIADSNSNITNLSDGKVYPYLFWEGRGGMYETPSRGFVVEQKDVHGFLTDKLHLLGLNDKESADFMEFWEPKMQGSPYYFVTFMGNQVMDSLAPLSVTPKPDTVIRILMDFSPLEHSINVEGYNIRTPTRKGFTVVEWGGVLR